MPKGPFAVFAVGSDNVRIGGTVTGNVTLFIIALEHLNELLAVTVKLADDVVVVRIAALLC